MAEISVWNKKTIALITGGSQNLGRAIVEHFTSRVAKGSTIIVTSRNRARLEQNLAQIKSKNAEIQLVLEEVDFTKPDPARYKALLNKYAGSDGGKEFEIAIIVHNAATLGDMSKRVIEMNNAKEIEDQLNVNVVSMITLNSIFLNAVKNVPRRIVVNMSAASAIQAMPSFGMTSMVKCSRHMLLNILAKEEPSITVLHFNPGAVDTNPLREIRDNSHSLDIRKWIKDMYDNHQVLNEEECVLKLVKTLEMGNYESGQTVSALQH